MNTTPSGPDDTPCIRLSGPEDIIGSLPYLLGFRPTESLVTVALTTEEPKSLLGALRVDLLDPVHYSAVVEATLKPLSSRGPVRAVLVLVTDQDGMDVNGADLPGRALIEQCEAAFAMAGILVDHSVWTAATTAGAPWRCYDDADHTGVVADLGTSSLAAYSVLAGNVTYGSRAVMVASLALDPDDVLARRSVLLEALAAAHQPHRSDPFHRFSELDTAIRAAQDGILPSSDEEAMRLVLALRDYTVRDACLSYIDDEWQEGAERLWHYLLRATPGSDRAEPAILLAIAAYLRDDGVAAGMALERARAANPQHRLTQLIGEALSYGMPPEQLRRAVTRTFREALDQVIKSDG